MVKQLGGTDTAQNAARMAGGQAPESTLARPHVASAIEVAGIVKQGNQVRFSKRPSVLANALEKEKRQGKAWRIALSLLRMDFLIFDALGDLPFNQAEGPCCFTCSQSCTSTPVW